MKNVKVILSLLLTLTLLVSISLIANAEEICDLRINVVAGSFYMKEGDGNYRFMGTDYSNSFQTAGTVITLLAEPDGDYSFLYWKNGNGKIVSTSEEYSFILGSGTSLTGVYDKTYDKRSYVTFLTASNQEISRQLYSKTVDVSRIQIPNEIPVIGYTFLGWSIDGITPVELDSLKAAIGSAMQSGNVILTPVYTKEFSDYYVVNVTNGNGSGEYSLLEIATAIAEPTNGGLNFSCWINGEGETVSYDREYKFAVTENETLTAVYSSDNNVQGVVNRITGAFRNNDNTVTFVSQKSLAGDYTLIQSGIIIVNNSAVGQSDDDFIIGGSGVEKGTSTSVSANAYMLTKNNAYGVWYARPYVIYIDGSGDVVTNYGNIISVD